MAIGGENPEPPTGNIAIVPDIMTSNIYYQDAAGTNTSSIAIENPNTSTNFTVCATSEAAPGINLIDLQTEGSDQEMYFTNKGQLTVFVSAPISYPTTLLVPIGGCSAWQNITLPMVPPTQVNVSIDYSNSNAVTLEDSGTSTFTVVSPDDFNSSRLTKAFKICSTASAESTLSYTFKVSVSGTDEEYYIAANPDLIVTVYTPGANITAPINISVPKGGCSDLQTISISKLPTSDVAVSLSNLTTNQLSTNLTANFTSVSTKLSQSFLICSRESVVVGSTGTLPFVVGGTNTNDYLLFNGDNLTFTITAAPSPTVTVSQVSSFVGGSGVIGISSNIEGSYYCSVREGGFSSDSNSLSYYKGLVDSNNTTIQSSADFLTHLYTQPRDWTVVSTSLVPGTINNLTVFDKRPETSYSYCCYYQNAAGTTTTGPSCDTNQTAADSNWQRHSVIFTFSAILNAVQRNTLLGYLTNATGAPTSQVVNRRGESYNSISTAPKKEWYVYKGATESRLTDTIFLTVRDNST